MQLPTNGVRVQRKAVEEGCAMIERHERMRAIALMCRRLDVSRSGYHDWRDGLPSARAQANQGLTDDIRRVHEKHQGRAGVPRVAAQFQTEGWSARKNHMDQLRNPAFRPWTFHSRPRSNLVHHTADPSRHWTWSRGWPDTPHRYRPCGSPVSGWLSDPSGQKLVAERLGPGLPLLAADCKPVMPISIPGDDPA